LIGECQELPADELEADWKQVAQLPLANLSARWLFASESQSVPNSRNHSFDQEIMSHHHPVQPLPPVSSSLVCDRDLIIVHDSPGQGMCCQLPQPMPDKYSDRDAVQGV
jgi:hypothetical protein